MKDEPYIILAKEILGFLEIHLTKLIATKDAVGIGNTSIAYNLLETSITNLTNLVEKLKGGILD